MKEQFWNKLKKIKFKQLWVNTIKYKRLGIKHLVPILYQPPIKQLTKIQGKSAWNTWRCQREKIPNSRYNITFPCIFCATKKFCVFRDFSRLADTLSATRKYYLQTNFTPFPTVFYCKTRFGDLGSNSCLKTGSTLSGHPHPTDEFPNIFQVHSFSPSLSQKV